MDPQVNQPRIPKNIPYLVIFLVAAGCAFLLVAAFRDYQGSGVLIAQSPDSKALLSISQADHQAEFIGIGKAKVRLRPGSYEVVSSFNGGQALAVAEVKKGQNTSINLPKNKDSILPSVYSINFGGTDEFINLGFTTTQVAELKQYFFNFKKNSSKVIIDFSSAQPAPHNPDTDIGFSTAFNVKVDSSEYKAVASNVGLDDLRLVLYDTGGNVVFDSGV